MSKQQPVLSDEYYANDVSRYLATHMPGKTIDDVPYSGKIIPDCSPRHANWELPFYLDGNPTVRPDIPIWEQNRVSIEFRYPGGGVFNLPPQTIITLDLNMARDGRKQISVVLGSSQIKVTIGDDVQGFPGGVLTGTVIELVARYK